MINEKQMMHGVDYLDEDVSGWLMSEKLDGCRAYWDGSMMWSRGGKVIAIPNDMRAVLPSGIALDGEIHAGRTGFEIARRAVQYGTWHNQIEFSAFDAPAVPGNFSVRYSFLENTLPFEGIVNFIKHEACTDIDDALSLMAEIQDCYEGEGVVLRDPENLYRKGRTAQILKLKSVPFHV
jgi:DNA ligase 1